MTWTPFDVEGYKLILDELATKAGVEIRFFTRVIDADRDAQAGKVKGVILSNRKPQLIRPAGPDSPFRSYLRCGQ